MSRVIAVKALKPYKLRLTFDDGKTAKINVESELYGEIFEPVKDPEMFAKVFVDPDFGTVCWPNGADFSAEYLEAASAALAT